MSQTRLHIHDALLHGPDKDRHHLPCAGGQRYIITHTWCPPTWANQTPTPSALRNWSGTPTPRIITHPKPQCWNTITATINQQPTNTTNGWCDHQKPIVKQHVDVHKSTGLWNSSSSQNFAFLASLPFHLPICSSDDMTLRQGEVQDTSDHGAKQKCEARTCHPP